MSPQTLKAMVASFLTTFGVATAVLISLWSEEATPSTAPYAYLLETKVATPKAVKPLPPAIQVRSRVVKTFDLNDWTSYPEPSGTEGYESFKELFQVVGTTTGVDPMLLTKMAVMESSLQSDVTAKCPEGVRCTATGLFQFTKTKWDEVVGRHGERFNFPANANPTDARLNTLMAAMSIRENEDLLKTVITNRELTDTDLYIVHVFGRTGAIRFFTANPATKAAPNHRLAAKSNYNIFYEKKQARTYEQIYLALDDKLANKISQFGIQ